MAARWCQDRGSAGVFARAASQPCHAGAGQRAPAEQQAWRQVYRFAIECAGSVSSAKVSGESSYQRRQFSYARRCSRCERAALPMQSRLDQASLHTADPLHAASRRGRAPAPQARRPVRYAQRVELAVLSGVAQTQIGAGLAGLGYTWRAIPIPGRHSSYPGPPAQLMRAAAYALHETVCQSSRVTGLSAAGGSSRTDHSPAMQAFRPHER